MFAIACSHTQQTIQFICLTLAVIAYRTQAINCPKNNTGLHWLVPPYAVGFDNDQNRHIGKGWLIDCRLNGSMGFITSNASLFQETNKHSIWRKRIPDKKIVLEMPQGFSLLSINNSDAGNYYCKLCNKTKYVGRLFADTSKEIPTIYSSFGTPIDLGSNVLYMSCRAKGVYSMSWIRVAADGSQTLMKSEDDSFWGNNYRYTRRRLGIQNFTASDEGLYMCLIRRPPDNYTAEREIYLRVQTATERHLPTHWYYTSFAKKQIDGHLMRFVLHVYACHLPVIAGLEVYVAIKGISWKRNFTADQPSPLRLARDSKYGIQMEMHIHPDGKYKDHLHVTVSLHNLVSNQSWEAMNQKFNIRKKCDREKCSWTSSNSLQCHRYLDNLDEKLNATFSLTLQNPCKKIFNLQIRDGDVAKSTNDSLFTAEFQNKTQARMQLKGFNQTILSPVKGRVKFAQFYLTLFVNDSSTNVHKVKLFLDTPDIGLRGKFIIMEGDFDTNAKCASPGHSGDDNTKTIALVILALFIIGLMLFAAVFIYRRRSGRRADVFLLTSMDDDIL